MKPFEATWAFWNWLKVLGSVIVWSIGVRTLSFWNLDQFALRNSVNQELNELAKLLILGFLHGLLTRLIVWLEIK